MRRAIVGVFAASTLGAMVACSAGNTKTPEVHRAAAQACSMTRPPSRTTAEAGADAGMPFPGSCQIDAECTNGTNGRCGTWYRGYGGPAGDIPAGPICTYDVCFNDGDCNAGPCVCDPGGNFCGGGNCKVDADCGTGGWCSPSAGGCSSLTGYFCHTLSDECRTNDDCKNSSGSGSSTPGQCTYDQSAKHWKCTALAFCD